MPLLRFCSILAARVQPTTLKVYQKSLGVFLEWARRHGRSVGTAVELDDSLCEFLVAERLSRSTFAVVVAAAEFAAPQIKGDLRLCGAYKRALNVNSDIHHTRPLPTPAALLIGLQLLRRGQPRLALALLLQLQVGLRPGELVGLRRADFLLPEEQLSEAPRWVIRLGSCGRKTKAKREQAVSWDEKRCPQLGRALRQVLEATPVEGRVFDTTYGRLRSALAAASRDLGLPVTFTPHSGRSGFATESVAAGTSPDVVRQTGRWGSEVSFRIYIDLAAAAAVETSVALRAWVGRPEELRDAFWAAWGHASTERTIRPHHQDKGSDSGSEDTIDEDVIGGPRQGVRQTDGGRQGGGSSGSSGRGRGRGSAGQSRGRGSGQALAHGRR